MKLKVLALIIITSLVPAQAYYPSTKIEFENVDIKRKHRVKIQDALLEYLDEYPEVLKPEGKRYKKDQYCKYQVMADPDSKGLKLETIKVLDEKKNIEYNLKVIDFLRSYNKELKINVEDPLKPIVMEFKYFAF